MFWRRIVWWGAFGVSEHGAQERRCACVWREESVCVCMCVWREGNVCVGGNVCVCVGGNVCVCVGGGDMWVHVKLLYTVHLANYKTLQLVGSHQLSAVRVLYS